MWKSLDASSVKVGDGKIASFLLVKTSTIYRQLLGTFNGYYVRFAGSCIWSDLFSHVPTRLLGKTKKILAHQQKYTSALSQMDQ